MTTPSPHDMAQRLLRYFVHSRDLRWRRAARALLQPPRPMRYGGNRRDDTIALDELKERLAAEPDASPNKLIRDVVRQLWPDATRSQRSNHVRRIRKKVHLETVLVHPE